jgi:pyruvate,water dikinase
VAVRSSGLAEDQADASHAGRYKSFLNVRGGAAVLEAAQRVVASVDAPLAGETGERAPMAVLVQRMVPADAAGVAFSRNPLTGALDEVRISATRGLGDRLLAGETDGQEWSVKGSHAVPQGKFEACITAATAVRVAELARAVEAARGAPQDIEWAAFGTQILLLQARPITVLPIAPVIETPKGSWQKDRMHFAEPITPYGASTNLMQDEPFDVLMQEWGFLPEKVRSRVIGHEYYIHIEPDDGGAKPPPWWVLAIVVRLVPSMRRKLRRSREVVESGLLESLPIQWERELKPALQARLCTLREVELRAFDDKALMEHLHLLERFLTECMTLHFRLMVPNLLGVYELSKVCQELLGWESHQMVRLVQGLSTTSSASTRALEEIATFLRDRPRARSIVAEARPTFVSELERVDAEAWAKVTDYLQTWGVRTLGSDAGTPNVEEKPQLVATSLRDLMDSDKKASPLAVREQAIQEAHDALKSTEQRERFDRALRYAELVYPLREDNVLLTDQLPTGLLRRVGLEFGRRLRGRGLLESAEDAAMLSAGELRAALAGSSDANWRELVRRRKGELLWVRANPGPPIYGPTPGPLPDLRGLPEASRRFNEAMLWEVEQELSPPAEVEGGALGGLAASSGVYRGKVRVIRSLTELHTLRVGEVLVCPTTSAAWMMVFARAGALVTEGGSPLCHTAIVAREHALPAIVSVAGATSLLQTGEEVIVDGTRGIVTRCA